MNFNEYITESFTPNKFHSPEGHKFTKEIYDILVDYTKGKFAFDDMIKHIIKTTAMRSNQQKAFSKVMTNKLEYFESLNAKELDVLLNDIADDIAQHTATFDMNEE